MKGRERDRRNVLEIKSKPGVVLLDHNSRSSLDGFGSDSSLEKREAGAWSARPPPSREEKRNSGKDGEGKACGVEEVAIILNVGYGLLRASSNTSFGSSVSLPHPPFPPTLSLASEIQVKSQATIEERDRVRRLVGRCSGEGGGRGEEAKEGEEKRSRSNERPLSASLPLSLLSLSS